MITCHCRLIIGRFGRCRAIYFGLGTLAVDLDTHFLYTCSTAAFEREQLGLELLKCSLCDIIP